MRWDALERLPALLLEAADGGNRAPELPLGSVPCWGEGLPGIRLGDFGPAAV